MFITIRTIFVRGNMKSVYDKICNQCNDYIYDVESVYQKLFQRIYNAATTLYCSATFCDDRNKVDFERIKLVLTNINNTLSKLILPKEKEEDIQKILKLNGFDANKLLIETPALLDIGTKDNQ